ncbi:streptophobe family protein [Trujillonella endophytica]|uniref:Uncharacterized protein n=1 Tax=Trujillonella endophytica TaxID=673521 RepID=A0A1H8W4W8_9ACTN|nr:streptophobe family protein [Trujillella endophytica]SEP22686.1 hypothetical protein SAMN05660991_04067 [Trujillella endophytica]
MTQSLCGNCGTGLQYGSGWCPGCGMAVTPAVPAPAAPSFAGQAPPVQPPYVPQPPYEPRTSPMPYPQGAPVPPPGYGAAPYGAAPYGSSPYGGGPGVPPPGWSAVEALLTGDWLGPAKSAVLAVVAMLGVSLFGMLLIANGDLGFAETLVLILAGVCLAVGGDAFAEAEADSFDSATASVSIGVLPLTVTLVGMLVLGATFARRLRRGEVARGRDVLADLVRTALVFALLFIPLPLLARYTPDRFDDGGLGELVDLNGRLGVGVWSTLFGALLFAVATTGLVALLRRSAPLLGRFRPRVMPALRGALVVFAAGTVGAVVFMIWALAENGGEEGVPQFLGVSLLAFVNATLAVVLWAAGGQLTGEGGLTDEITGTSSIDLLTFTDVHGAFWLAPVVLFAVMQTVAVVVVLRQHTMLTARLEGLRFAAALAFVALVAALLLRFAVDSSTGGGGFRAGVSVEETFNPFLVAFILALWGAVTGLLAPAIAAGLPPNVVQAVRRRYGMADAPVAPPAPAPVQPPAPPQHWQ